MRLRIFWTTFMSVYIYIYIATHKGHSKGSKLQPERKAIAEHFNWDLGDEQAVGKMDPKNADARSLAKNSWHFQEISDSPPPSLGGLKLLVRPLFTYAFVCVSLCVYMHAYFVCIYLQNHSTKIKMKHLVIFFSWVQLVIIRSIYSRRLVVIPKLKSVACSTIHL